MRNRWKFQLKVGLFWGILMSLMFVLFNLNEMTFMEQFKTTNFYFRTIGFILSGVFLVGYVNWKEKNRSDKNDN